MSPSYYIKFDRYIAEVEIYCDSNKSNKKSCVPICYRIKRFIDIITNKTDTEKIDIDENGHCCVIQDYNEHTIFKHYKSLYKSDLVIYNNICKYTVAKIRKDILTNDDEINIYIIDELKKAYTDINMAFYENFILNEQYKLFPNGYSGLHKEYVFSYNADGFLKEEYYHNNGLIDGIKKIFCRQCTQLEIEENYVNGQKYGITKYHIHNNDMCKYNKNYQTRNYFNDNYYYLEEFDENMNIIKTGYYFTDINITWLVKMKQLFFS